MSKLKVAMDPGAILPTRAHEDDAGLDLYSPIDAIVKPHSSVEIDTGIHAAIPRGFVGFLKSKSGLLFHHDISTEGVVDSGYTGSVRVKVMNLGDFHHTIRRGEKVSQLVVLPIITPEIEIVSNLEATERGDGGFGSTGA